MDTNKTITIPVETVGQAYLEILRARGIKYFFGNSGTDFGPIIDGLAKLVADKKMHPMPITVPHEFVGDVDLDLSPSFLSGGSAVRD
jgi:hypothetical protein